MTYAFQADYFITLVAIAIRYSKSVNNIAPLVYGIYVKCILLISLKILEMFENGLGSIIFFSAVLSSFRCVAGISLGIHGLVIRKCCDKRNIFIICLVFMIRVLFKTTKRIWTSLKIDQIWLTLSALQALDCSKKTMQNLATSRTLFKSWHRILLTSKLLSPWVVWPDPRAIKMHEIVKNCA